MFEAFQKCIKATSDVDQANGVAITLCGQDQNKIAILSLPLLQAASVLLSIWKDSNEASQKMEVDTPAAHGRVNDAAGYSDAAVFIASLTNMLLHPIDMSDDSVEEGLASAKIVQSGASAVSVESVSHSLKRHEVSERVQVLTSLSAVDHASESTE